MTKEYYAPLKEEVLRAFWMRKKKKIFGYFSIRGSVFLMSGMPYANSALMMIHNTKI